MTSGRSQENSFIVIMLYQESNCTCREETFPIPTKYIDVTGTTHTSLDVLLEKNIEDYWNVDGQKRMIRCMDKLHKIHLIERKAT